MSFETFWQNKLIFFLNRPLFENVFNRFAWSIFAEPISVFFLSLIFGYVIWNFLAKQTYILFESPFIWKCFQSFHVEHFFAKSISAFFKLYFLCLIWNFCRERFRVFSELYFCENDFQCFTWNIVSKMILKLFFYLIFNLHFCNQREFRSGFLFKIFWLFFFELIFASKDVSRETFLKFQNYQQSVRRFSKNLQVIHIFWRIFSSFPHRVS